MKKIIALIIFSVFFNINAFPCACFNAWESLSDASYDTYEVDQYNCMSQGAGSSCYATAANNHYSRLGSYASSLNSCCGVNPCCNQQ
jgi:hypothetical protein